MKLDRPKNFSIFVATALVSLSGCKFGSDASGFKDLKQGIQISRDLTRDPNKTQVLVYYANNPTPTAGYMSEKSKILATITEAKNDPTIPAAALEKTAQGFDSDMDNFSDAVAIDTFGIKNSICSEKATVGSGAIIITNDGIIGNSVSFCTPKGSLKPIPASEMKRLADIYARIKRNPIHEHSPLSHPDMLNASLDVVRSIFPTQKHEYSIVVKSHGSEKLTITPKVAYESRIITREFLRDRFARKKISPMMVLGNGNMLDKDGLEKDGLEKDGLDKDGLDKDGLDKDGLDKEGLDSAGLIRGDSPQGAVAAGITKFQMLGALLNTDRDLFFNVVFMESCRSDIGDLILDLGEVMAPTIGMIYASDEKGLSYNTIDWSKLERSGAVSLRDWMMQELNAKAAKSAK